MDAVQRETHRQAYSGMLTRLAKAVRLSPKEQDEWAREIKTLAWKCNRDRALAIGVTQQEADLEHGSVLEVARELALGCSGATFEERLESVGFVRIERRVA